MASVCELRWYLIHCKPNQDERALENLQRQRFECYRPTRPVQRNLQGRCYLAEESLFPRYLFIRLDRVNDNWAPIRSTRGVLQVVRFADSPLPVPDAIIDGIRTRLSDPGQEPYLKPGEGVRITEGAFAHLEAIFLSDDGDDRVAVLLNILHQTQQLVFPLSSVRRLA